MTPRSSFPWPNDMTCFRAPPRVRPGAGPTQLIRRARLLHALAATGLLVSACQCESSSGHSEPTAGAAGQSGAGALLSTGGMNGGEGGSADESPAGSAGSPAIAGGRGGAGSGESTGGSSVAAASGSGGESNSSGGQGGSDPALGGSGNEPTSGTSGSIGTGGSTANSTGAAGGVDASGGNANTPASGGAIDGGSAGDGGLAGGSSTASWSCGTAAGICRCVPAPAPIENPPCGESDCCFVDSRGDCFCRLAAAVDTCEALSSAIGAVSTVDACPQG